jgi:tRNA (guanosine-2'-O-)-methyltransferase
MVFAGKTRLRRWKLDMHAQRFDRIVATLDRRQPDLSILMENVHKTRNLGALARTCDAVGIGVIHAVAPDSDAVKLGHKTAGGTEKWIALHRHTSTKRAFDGLRESGLVILAAGVTADAVDFRAVDYTRPTAIVVGSELDGLSKDAAANADQCIQIPLMGMVESLNVSVATGIILYEAARQRSLAGMYDKRRIEEREYDRLLFEWLHPSVAKYCQEHHRAYPRLNDKGEITESITGNRRDGLKSIA